MDFRKTFYSILIFLGLSIYSSNAMITAAHVEQVRNLTAQGKLPGRASDYNGIMPNQLVDRVVDVISSAHSFMKRYILPAKFFGGTSKNLLNGDLTLILPEAIRDDVKVQYWIRNGIILSQDPIGSIQVFERNRDLLLQTGLIPGGAALIGMNLRDLAKYYVDHYSQSNIFGSWSVANNQHKIVSSLKYLPLNFQNDVKRYYHCRMLTKSEDIWLNNEKINIPASYFVEYNILPFPPGIDLDALKNLERNNQINQEARLYADFIINLDNPAFVINNRIGTLNGLVAAVKFFLPTTFRDKIVEQYAIATNMTGRLIHDNKYFGSYSYEISLGQLLDVPGIIDSINQELAVSHKLNLVNKKIKSVAVADFNRINFGAIKELSLPSKINIKELPDLRTFLPNLQKLEIIYS